MKTIVSVLCTLCMVLLVACTGGAGNAAKKDITALHAWNLTEDEALTWHEDAKIVQVGSLVSRNSLALGGKPRGWDFQVSSEAAMATYVLSYHGVVDRVVILGPEKPFESVDRVPYRPIGDLSEWKIDSDDAFRIAERAGGKAARKSDPDLDVIYTMHWSPKFETVIWDLNYGSHSKPTFEVAIDATSGDVLDTPVPFPPVTDESSEES